MKFLKLNTFMYFSVLFMFNFDANAQSMTIEEVIVSAEKREESLQDISQSVTALTEEELETKNITEAQAHEYILGYCIVNDISEREWQLEMGGNWTKGKSGDTFGPVGPYLVTKDEISNIDNLSLTLKLNKKIMQTGNTDKMIFNVFFILSYLSKFMSLQPGDIVTTGTPPGVGMGMKPQVFLKKTDVMHLAIDCLGEQKQEVI